MASNFINSDLNISNDIEMVEIYESKEIDDSICNQSIQSNDSSDSLPSIHFSIHEVNENNWQDWVNFSADESFLVDHELQEERVLNLSASSLASLDWGDDFDDSSSNESGYSTDRSEQ